MRVFVTGASGLIGKAVVKELLGAGHSVLGLARSDEKAAEVKALGADVHQGSLTDLESLKSGAAAADGVIHLAFIHRFDDFQAFEQSCKTDRDAIQAMAEVLAGTDRPLVMSSGTMLLPKGRLLTEEDLPDPNNPLGTLRGQSETLAKELATKGIRTAVMRLAPTNHGDEDKHGFISILSGTAQKNGFAAYIGDGTNHWPATHYLDTAVAYRLALEKAPAGSTLHVIAEEGVKMKDIAEIMGKKLGLPVVSKTMDQAEKVFGMFGFAVAADNMASSKKTRELLGWSPKQCTLLEDLEGGRYFN
jgi:nucleoside-diphosphate-sugar epimerase